jgi:hypothetical protein
MIRTTAGAAIAAPAVHLHRLTTLAGLLPCGLAMAEDPAAASTDSFRKVAESIGVTEFR